MARIASSLSFPISSIGLFSAKPVAELVKPELVHTNAFAQLCDFAVSSTVLISVSSIGSVSRWKSMS